MLQVSYTNQLSKSMPYALWQGQDENPRPRTFQAGSFIKLHQGPRLRTFSVVRMSPLATSLTFSELKNVSSAAALVGFACQLTVND